MPSSLTASPAPAAQASAAQALKHENSRLLREDIARQALAFRGLPEIVTLNSTEICNLACVMCQRSVSQGKYRLEDRVVEFVAEQLLPTARKVVLTTAGGEPLGVGFDLILDLARRYETRIDVTSNGQLLREDVAERLLPALDHLNISVDSVRPEIYERIRVGGSFDKLANNLSTFHRLRSAGDHDVLLSLSAVVMASTLPYLDELVRFAASVGAQGVLLQRLQHTVKSTPEEDPAQQFSAEEIEGFYAAAEAAARECGVNIFQGELGRPPVFVRPMRSKRPEPLDGEGVCSFLTQTFSVMYTGEVYPCCKPTDHLLGDVRFDDPVSIWNGEALQELRRAHYERVGTVFCRGCELAPYLPQARSKAVGEALKVGRRALAHVVNRRRREQRESRELPLYDVPQAKFERRAALNPTVLERPSVRLFPLAFEALAVDPVSLETVGVCDGTLYRWDGESPEPRRWAALPGATGRFASLLHFTPQGDALLSFEGGGGVLRFDRGMEQLVSVSDLSDPRSFVRSGSVASTDDGLFVGEYGLFPGARCANIWRSRDGGHSFEQVQSFPYAHHIHALAALDRQRLIATCGDLPRERKSWLGTRAGEQWECVLDTWSGFTAICVDGEDLHLGTDLRVDNGIVQWTRSMSGRPSLTPLAAPFDLQLRQIERLANGRLVALGALDEGLAAERQRARPALFGFEPVTERWRVVHAFADDWSDAPEAFLEVPGRPGCLLTARGPVSQLIEVPPA